MKKYPFAAVVLSAVFFTALLIANLSGCAKNPALPNEASLPSASGNAADTVAGGTQNRETSTESFAVEDIPVIAEGESLVIPIAELSETVRFYPIEVDGTQMEIIAVLDADGNVRTAFNTCQVCYDSGKGYYRPSGDMLVCQNCGSRFSVDQIEVESGGCNPYPIFADNKETSEESVSISYDFLDQARRIFTRWKTNY